MAWAGLFSRPLSIICGHSRVVRPQPTGASSAMTTIQRAVALAFTVPAGWRVPHWGKALAAPSTVVSRAHLLSLTPELRLQMRRSSDVECVGPYFSGGTLRLRPTMGSRAGAEAVNRFQRPQNWACDCLDLKRQAAASKAGKRGGPLVKRFSLRGVRAPRAVNNR